MLMRLLSHPASHAAMLPSRNWKGGACVPHHRRLSALARSIEQHLPVHVGFHPASILNHLPYAGIRSRLLFQAHYSSAFLAILIDRCSQITADVVGDAFLKRVKALIVSCLAQFADVGLGEILIVFSN